MKDILKQNKRHLSLKCIAEMGIHILKLLERFHSIGYIHCDIKPDNILLGDYSTNPKMINKLFLIDFGISEKYVDENNKHLPFKRDVPFKGNIVFSSKNCF